VRRFWIGLTLGLIAVLIASGVAWALTLQHGAPLSARDQAALLQRANLPPDFPIHPAARRMPQAAQGGLSYGVTSQVPDVATWLRDQLRRTGFLVDEAELEGDPEAAYKDHWINFGRTRNGVRSTGWVIVRQTRLRRIALPTLPALSTEVKVLSEQDDRLKPLPTITPVATAPLPVVPSPTRVATAPLPVVPSPTRVATPARSS
jgi:hypothetical protein